MDTAGTAAGPTQATGVNGARSASARTAPQRRGRTRPRVRRPYHRHGLTNLQRTVASLGGRVLDGRFAVTCALREWRGALVRDLGGDVSTQDTSNHR